MNIFCKKINFYIRLCGFAIELQIQVYTQYPLRSSHALIGICNPDVYNIRIFNPLSHCKCLYSMRADCKSARAPQQ